MFAKVFGQIFDSSIAEDFNTRRMFIDLLILADPDGVVDMTPEAIARRTNVPLSHVLTHVKQLQQPDKTSRSKAHEGRRIVPIDPNREWGWQIVNYAHYRRIRDEEARRSYFREYQRKRRKSKNVFNKKVNTVNSVENASSSSSLYSSFPGGFREEWDHFIEHRKNKKAPMTAHSQELFLKTLSERPEEAIDALKMAIMRNWTGFKWDWFDSSKSVNLGFAGQSRPAKTKTKFDIEWEEFQAKKKEKESNNG